MHGTVTAASSDRGRTFVERAHHDVQRVSVKRVHERRDFPSAKMSGEGIGTPLATGEGALEVFESIVDHDLVDILKRVFWGKRQDLGELAAERGEFPAQDAGRVSRRLFLRECERPGLRMPTWRRRT